MSERVSAALLIVGASFMLLASLGMLRLPDLFMRLQAATKASTLGVACLLLGAAFHFQDLAVTTRAVLVIAFFVLTAPVGAHMIARAAYAVGVPLWEGTITDELYERRRAAKQPAPDGPAEGPVPPPEAGDTPGHGRRCRC
ncbi:MAG TPA: monovalent cation/H(+) antiporter subunit G [Gemmataceae bacterium]|nr:monovalent cation/H(+) antiporter subunit G [Gemmataceae bacterium]